MPDAAAVPAHAGAATALPPIPGYSWRPFSVSPPPSAAPNPGREASGGGRSVGFAGFSPPSTAAEGSYDSYGLTGQTSYPGASWVPQGQGGSPMPQYAIRLAKLVGGGGPGTLQLGISQSQPNLWTELSSLSGDPSHAASASLLGPRPRPTWATGLGGGPPPESVGGSPSVEWRRLAADLASKPGRGPPGSKGDPGATWHARLSPDALRHHGLDDASVTRLYRMLRVYTIGFHEHTRQLVAHVPPEAKTPLLLDIWAFYVRLWGIMLQAEFEHEVVGVSVERDAAVFRGLQLERDLEDRTSELAALKTAADRLVRESLTHVLQERTAAEATARLQAELQTLVATTASEAAGREDAASQLDGARHREAVLLRECAAAAHALKESAVVRALQQEDVRAAKEGERRAKAATAEAEQIASRLQERLREIEPEAEHARSVVARAEKEVHDASYAKRMLTAEVTFKAEEVAKLRSRCDRLEKELQKARDANGNEVSKAKTDFDAALWDVRAELAVLRAANPGLVADATSRREELLATASKLSEVTRELTILQHKRQEESDAFARLSAQAAVHEAAMETLQSSVVKLKAENYTARTQADADKAELRSALKARGDELESARFQLTAIKDEMRRRDDDSRSSRDANGSTQAAALEMARAEAADERASRIRTDGELDLSRRELATTRSSLLEEKKKVERLQAVYAAESASRQVAEAESTKHKARCDALSREVDAAKAVSALAEATMGRMQAEAQDAADESAAREASAAARAVAAEAAVRTAETALAEKAALVEEIHEELEAVGVELEATRAAAEAAASQSASRAESLESELIALRAEAGAQAEAMRRSAADDAARAAETSAAKVAAVAAECESLKSHLASLVADGDAVSAELASAKATIVDLTALIESLRTELAGMEARPRSRPSTTNSGKRLERPFKHAGENQGSLEPLSPRSARAAETDWGASFARDARSRSPASAGSLGLEGTFPPPGAGGGSRPPSSPGRPAAGGVTPAVSSSAGVMVPTGFDALSGLGILPEEASAHSLGGGTMGRRVNSPGAGGRPARRGRVFGVRGFGADFAAPSRKDALSVHVRSLAHSPTRAGAPIYQNINDPYYPLGPRLPGGN